MEFGDDNPCFLPVNDFANNAIGQVSAWLIEGEHTPFTTLMGSLALCVFSPPVADVPDVETQYHAHEFLDATVQPKPIEISPNEVYSIHRVLSEYLDYLVSVRRSNGIPVLLSVRRLPNVMTPFGPSLAS